ncbi:hypothetical protein HYH02_011615 [Chlamydomonas schloesseri]|uniref:Uncharacterized protein n=1 Tax=Chlamydomonas schloesseri TaxID=2026947 RepID=A0A835W1R7_9CHLO|nr:hypothetical protein HYH02_011615 [Chlamydomonas schloesseri]|eukprot:KAG2436105.1 hypothetical protein HYH02_011615 [Chlamydomonas schloesseri]
MKEQRLILPGQQQRGAPGGGRIVFPEKQGGSGKPGGGGVDNFLPDDSTLGLVGESLVGGPATLNKYRPPAGFMNETLPEDAYSSMEPQEMLNKLRARAGRWHELAKLIAPLNSAGYSSSSIDEITGVTPLEQNKWVVAATVYESIKASGIAPEVLRHFDQGGEELLPPFRFLSAERRVSAAQYIAEQDLDPPMCEILARSMKEYERRPTERVGFTDHPADCLAFKYLRDAIECRKREEAVQKVEQGLGVAVTDGARQRLYELLEDASPEADMGVGVSASLVTLRLDPEELGVRPVAVLGELGHATIDDLRAAPRASQGGAFGIFTIEPAAADSSAGASSAASTSGRRAAAAASSWVALPMWRALAMARQPVGLLLKDCASVQAVLTGTKAKTDEDKKRLSGPGMIVADKAPALWEEKGLDENAWYLAQPEGARAIMLVDGARAKAQELDKRGALCGIVLFLARPPVKETEDRGHNLLQV